MQSYAGAWALRGRPTGPPRRATERDGSGTTRPPDRPAPAGPLDRCLPGGAFLDQKAATGRDRPGARNPGLGRFDRQSLSNQVRDNPSRSSSRCQSMLGHDGSRSNVLIHQGFSIIRQGAGFQGASEQLGGSSRVIGKQCQSINRPGLRGCRASKRRRRYHTGPPVGEWRPRHRSSQRT